jgi:hypothetical protein
VDEFRRIYDAIEAETEPLPGPWNGIDIDIVKILESASIDELEFVLKL